MAYLALGSTLSPHGDSPVTDTGPHDSLPSPLGLCLSSSLSSVVAFWDSGSLVLSRLCPNSIWGPSPPSSQAIHTSLLSFFIPSSLADRLLSHVAWSLLVRVSPRLILGICWLSALFVLRGFLSASAWSCRHPPGPSPSSQSPLWDTHFYLPLICLLSFVERNERLS